MPYPQPAPSRPPDFSRSPVIVEPRVNMFPLTPQQLQVVDALSSGATLTDAAAQAGIHRNTVANWRRNSPDFQEALTRMSHTRCL